ncbi:glycosyltransferase [Streptomyces endophyticus]|uniref:Galactosyltransferase-related protein n=1 Tax=Streptomyces endophyticus TaxID=714166 RepID=A0ABU6F8F2_9ACTN|nr:galactosyltransferase-related protein [Streptomyces endophyticus]MEB8340248.1 galactosyltransferase-related protein [Streptomyces endophyticus]
MTALHPTDPLVLATAAADTLVVAADPESRRSCVFFWEKYRPLVLDVERAAGKLEDPRLHSLAQALRAAPEDPDRHRALVHALAADAPHAATTTALLDAAWLAERDSRLGHHLGARHRAGAAPVTLDELRAVTPRHTPAAAPDAPVLVVIPFRDRDTDGTRVRNLLACLLSLGDQSVSRDRFRVTVVECDDRPRWRDVIAPHVDRYLFAPKADTFNKSWAVNCGVLHTAGEAEAICILDADILTDRDFIARNVARLRRRGTGGHLTYRDMLGMSEDSTAHAVRRRVLEGAAEADPEEARGFVVRRPPGACVWARTGVFHQIGGLDERYEGWGGEDTDFAYRMDFAAAFDSFDDPLLHMNHPPAAVLGADGELVNSHIPWLSWDPREPIGRLDRFAPAPH